MPELSLSAISFELERPTQFWLRIETFKFMNPKFMIFQKTELGQLEIEVMKSPSPYFWKNLHSNVFYNPNTMHTWWEIYYKYRE